MLEILDSVLVPLGVLESPRDALILLAKGTAHCLKCGKSMGMLVVMTATKVSRTAHEPASWAPLIGSFNSQ